MDGMSQKLQLLLKSKDFASVQQAVELLSCFPEEVFLERFWDQWNSMDDVEHHLLEYHHKEVLKIWLMGNFMNMLQTGFNRYKGLRLRRFRI